MRGLLESLCRDTDPNPPFTGEESQTSHRGGLDRDILPEGEAFVDSQSLVKLAGKKLTTLLMKAGRGQQKVKRLEANLACGSCPPENVSEDMEDQWSALDRAIWRSRTKLAFKSEQEVENHLTRTTRFLRGQLHPYRDDETH